MLQLLIYLRYLSVAGQVLTVLFVTRLLGLGLPTAALLSVSACLLVFNIASHCWCLRVRTGGPRALMLQLLVDMLALTALLYFSGGPSNPFVSLYLVPVALAAIGLEMAPMLALTAVAAVLYTALLQKHLPMPMGHDHDFQLHVIGMWVNFLLTAIIMAASLSRLMAVVNTQRRALSAARERALRDESLLALGSLAAGTAHELNTPLTTMGLLIEDWSASPAAPSASDFGMMCQQLAHCRDHVRALVEIARRGATDEAVSQPAGAFLRDCVDRWKLLRPSVDATLKVETGNRNLVADATLPQALINLFNNADANAATGSDTAVEINAEIRDSRPLVQIRDRGPGPRAIAASGAHPDGTGLGIGLMISNAGIERNHGQVRQRQRDGGGCITEVELPASEVAT